MWKCDDKLHRKTAHFRLPPVAQKRRVLKLPNNINLAELTIRKLNFVIQVGEGIAPKSYRSEGQPRSTRNENPSRAQSSVRRKLLAMSIWWAIRELAVMPLSFASLWVDPRGTQGEWYSFGISFFPAGELSSFGNDFAGPRGHTHGICSRQWGRQGERGFI